VAEVTGDQFGCSYMLDVILTTVLSQYFYLQAVPIVTAHKILFSSYISMIDPTTGKIQVYVWRSAGTGRFVVNQNRNKTQQVSLCQLLYVYSSFNKSFHKTLRTFKHI
jgi:hypothetical protein